MTSAAVGTRLSGVDGGQRGVARSSGAATTS
jgi:hypothetical protein